MTYDGQEPLRRQTPSGAPDFDEALNLCHLQAGPDSSGQSEWEADEPGGSPLGKEPGLMGPEDLVRRLIVEFRSFCKCARPDEQIDLLGRMQQHIKTFRGLLAGADLPLWAKFTGAVSTLLFAMVHKPGFPTFSAFRTMADALELLQRVAACGSGWRGTDPAPITVLTMAEDASRRALQVALQNQGMNVTDCDSAEKAWLHLGDIPFDVIFLDTALPEMDHFAFSTRLRRLAHHPATPLVFLTTLPDFGSRSESVLDDGCDFIAKPILPSEAVVKAFAFGLKYRLDAEPSGKVPAKLKAPPAPPEVAPSVVPAPAVTTPVAVLPPGVPAQDAKELAEADDRRVKAEEQAAQLAKASARLQEQEAARALQFRQVQEQAAELEKTRQALNAELKRSSRRETRLKQECANLEQQMESLNQSLGRLGQDLAEENQRRLTAEQQAGQLTGRLDEVIRAESAARQQLGQMARDHARELARLQAALQKEIRARELAEQADAELSAAQTRLEKQLADGWLQAQRALEGHAALPQTQKLIQAELREVLERQSQLQQQLAALDEPLRTLSETLRPPE
jgi:DNA-binding response OmpR family regulator